MVNLVSPTAMSWVTVIWTAISAASLTLAGVHLLVWWWRRAALVNLLFAVTAMATTLFGAGELWMMHAATPEEFAMALRWTHLPVFVLVVSMAGFVRLYLGAGRLWLAWTICWGRVFALSLNFLTGVNLNYRQITAVRRIPFLGEPVSVAVGVPNPWMLAGQLSTLAVIIFVADASLTVWRRGERRKALVGGAIMLFALAAQFNSVLVFWGYIQGPILACEFYLGIVAAMGLELSRDVLRTTELSDKLREGEQRMILAAEATNFGIWIWDLVTNEIWASEQWRALFGFANLETLDFDGILQRVHPEDREAIRAVITKAISAGGRYETEYRVLMPDGRVRWIASQGRVECKEGGKPAMVRGVSLNITARKQAELELHERRGELMHLSRVAMLGELSGSLAHELNQPLTAILSNTQAVQRYLKKDPFNLPLVLEILSDIVSEDERGGEIIQRLRLLLKKGEIQLQALDANEVILEVLKLARSDLANHGVTVETALASGHTQISGDRVQLQQVILNLVMNANDAMAGNESKDRRLTLRTQLDGETGLRIEVSDVGRGLPAGGAERAFERFFTTKPHGLGLGLSVCRTILAAHGGTLGAENNSGRGATFHCVIPLLTNPCA